MCEGNMTICSPSTVNIEGAILSGSGEQIVILPSHKAIIVYCQTGKLA